MANTGVRLRRGSGNRLILKPECYSFGYTFLGFSSSGPYFHRRLWPRRLFGTVDVELRSTQVVMRVDTTHH